MKPILYDASETSFQSLGIGVLSEAIECFVTEERNGVFECSFKYPITGKLFNEIVYDRWIKCDASYDLKDQRFKIVTISKPMKGYIDAYCEHCSYLTAQLMLEPSVEIRNQNITESVEPVDAYEALSQWLDAIVDDNPITIDTQTDISFMGTTKWSIKDVDSARKALGGVSGSILDVWGGEYKFDNYKIGLFTHRGINNGVSIRYGKNLTDINQEESIANTYTSVYPFATYTDDESNEHVVTLDPPYYIDSEYAENFESRRILRVDFSNEFQEGTTPTKERLASLTNSYIENNRIGIPSINISLSYMDLAKTINYHDYKFIEQVNLCDTVRVYFEKLGVNTTAKVIKCVWDVINERMDQIDVGDAKASLSDTINKQQTAINDIAKEAGDVKGTISSAVQRATQLITGNMGGHIVIKLDDDNKPQEFLIMDTDDMTTAQKVWRYNLNGWGYSSSGIGGPYTIAATVDGQIVASLITTGILRDEFNNFYLDMQNGNLRISNGFKIVSGDEIEKSFSEIIDGLSSDVEGVQDNLNSEISIQNQFIAELNQKLNSLSLNFATRFSGGSNLIRNSSGLNGVSDDWEVDAVQVVAIQDDDARTYTDSGSYFKINEGSLTYEAPVVPDKQYTLTFKAKKGDNYNGTVSLTGGSPEYSVTISDQNWQEVSGWTFTATNGNVKLTAETTGSDFRIADIMLAEGDQSHYWSPAPNEIYTDNVKVDRRGIHVSNADSKTETLIDNTQFAVIDTSSEEPVTVLTVNRDLTELKRTQIEGEMTVGKVKFIPKSEGIDIAVLD